MKGLLLFAIISLISVTAFAAPKPTYTPAAQNKYFMQEFGSDNLSSASYLRIFTQLSNDVSGVLVKNTSVKPIMVGLGTGNACSSVTAQFLVPPETTTPAYFPAKLAKGSAVCAKGHHVANVGDGALYLNLLF